MTFQFDVRNADLNLAAKVAFVHKCQAAGVQVEFGEDHVVPGHHEMIRRDSVEEASPAGGARGARARASASATTGGPMPAQFTGAAVTRDLAGSMLGLVAAVAAAAAI